MISRREMTHEEAPVVLLEVIQEEVHLDLTLSEEILEASIEGAEDMALGATLEADSEEIVEEASELDSEVAAVADLEVVMTAPGRSVITSSKERTSRDFN